MFQKIISDTKLLIVCRIFWIMHILVPMPLAIIKATQMNKNLSSFLFWMIIRLNQNAILWAQPMFTWIISLSLRERLIEWRKRLETDKRAQTIYSVRKAYVETRNAINGLDESMKWVYINGNNFIE